MSEWEYSGFLSRFMVISYKYDGHTVDDILDSIIEREYLGMGRINLKFPANPVNIDIPPAIAEAARDFIKVQTAAYAKDLIVADKIDKQEFEQWATRIYRFITTAPMAIQDPTMPKEAL